VSKLNDSRRRLFGASSDKALADILRTETVGGLLLLAGAALALIWANSPWQDAYHDLLGVTVGPSFLRLELDLHHWTSDGLLAIFFFVAGLELKRELVAGDLRDPAKAVLPVVAAICGVAIPAGIYLAMTASDASARHGWAIPVATDIAFALAVLAVLGSHLPNGLRSFLLTLAVVDDLIAITIIALFYTSGLDVWYLLVALIPLAGFGVLAQRRVTAWWLLVPLALTTWALVHAAGIHATVAGVLLALTVPAARRSAEVEANAHSMAERLEHTVRPLSSAVAVPLFALAAAGVTVSSPALRSAVQDPVVPAIVLALVAGKGIGIFVGTYLTARFTRAELDDDLAWIDVAGVALLAGIGFTVSLLISGLSFGGDLEREDAARLAVLTGSLLATLLAAAILVPRNTRYRRAEQADRADRAEQATGTT
jgi:Na+:H+ antiporter, NhaA family